MACTKCCNHRTSGCVHTVLVWASLSFIHTCVCTHALSPHILGLPPLRQGPDSSSRTQTEWGQRAWLIDRLVPRPSVPVQLFLGWGVVGVVGSGSASQWELRIKGPIQFGCLNSTPVGSCPQEGVEGRWPRLAGCLSLRHGPQCGG